MKPSIPKGTRDFGPVETARRNYIFDTIREAFRLFGYSQIETPAMENLSTLMGKYGAEGDKLLFKILNSGDYLKGVTPQMVETESLGALAAKLCDKGLRYDLTVPFARYVVQHRNELQLPFRRFQMQPVWRADRPQKGRYREFWQCDADVVGSDSLLNEVELLSLIDFVFNRFGIRVSVHINNRKVLAGLARLIGHEDKLIAITVAIDKMEKAGIEAVEAEMMAAGIEAEAVAKLRPVLTLSGTNEEKLSTLATLLADDEEGTSGVEELREVLAGFDAAGHTAVTELDVSLARGLNYYTGTIIEVKALDAVMGSITGGGRYDNLTGIFGMPGLSGVGISFGADRIYDVLTDLNLFPEQISPAPQIMFVNFGEDEARRALSLISDLRAKGVSAVLYPDAAKMKKQMAYANALGINRVAIIGENEFAAGTVTVKDMALGTQTEVTPDQLV